MEPLPERSGSASDTAGPSRGATDDAGPLVPRPAGGCPRGPPVGGAAAAGASAPSVEALWRRRVVVLVAALTAVRLLYVGSGALDLTEDEAYYWVWSRQLDWSYFSKGPLVAWIHRASTEVFGDTGFGVRFPAVALGAVTTVFAARLAVALHGSWRTGFWTAAALSCALVFSVGAVLTTIDGPLVCCWTVAAFFWWRASCAGSRWTDWVGAGLAIGAGLLAKAVMVFFLPGAILFLALERERRAALRTARPWLAILLGLAALVPQVMWNSRHGWPMFRDIAKKGGVDAGFSVGLGNTATLLASQAGILTPLLFAGVVWAAVVSFRRARRGDAAAQFTACLALPMIGSYLLLSLHTKTNPNWFVAGYVTLFVALARLAIEKCDAEGPRGTWRRWCAAALWTGGAISSAAHVAAPLAVRRVAGWEELAARADHWRGVVAPGAPDSVFLFGRDYQTPSVLRFYCKGAPHAVCLAGGPRENQYFYIDDLPSLRGQDAVWVDYGEPKPAYEERVRRAFASVEVLERFEVRRGPFIRREVTFRVCRGFAGWRYRE